MEWSLYDGRGRRKYLVPRERGAFLRAALQVGGPTASFCAVLVFTGARITEVLELTPERIDRGACTINFETLKQRKRGVTRAIPVPKHLLFYLDGVHHYADALKDTHNAGKRLWPWSRTTAWRRIKKVMRRTSNPEYLATARAVRHAFGAGARLESVGLEMIQTWMGHADIRTTAIYTKVIGKEERIIFGRTWKRLPSLISPRKSGV